MIRIHVRNHLKNSYRRRLFRVTPLADLAHQWEPGIRFLVRCSSSEDIERCQNLSAAGLRNVAALVAEIDVSPDQLGMEQVADSGHLQPSDVVSIADASAQVLFRATDRHHTVFLTDRCGNYCLMCSQPPREVDDSWLIDEACELACLIPKGPRVFGFTGGEPLELGIQLGKVLSAFNEFHPDAELEVLTNGRRLADADLAQSILSNLKKEVSWMVPLYGHADFLHDYVVQRAGAFDETLQGILNLQTYGQRIQLRTVLINPVLDELEEYCRFVALNLPFVESVAFMGCEPVGFALANREICDVDIRACQPGLERAIRVVERVGIKPVIMNVPLCMLPERLWPYAADSISDWKQTFKEVCAECEIKERCCGFFVWRPDRWSVPEPVPVRRQ